jgi:hypothetical protein
VKDKTYMPGKDVEPMKKKSLPGKPGTDLISKGEIQTKRIDASELFSHFTANIIKEKKVFTR